MLRLPPSSPRTYTLFPLTSLYRSWTGVLSPSEKGIMNISASQEAPIVLIVDDDEDVRIALSELMLSVGIEAACFGSTAELLQSPHLDRAGCLVLDVRMPGPTGRDLQQPLAESGIARQIVSLTGPGDIPKLVPALKAGAVVCLPKRVRQQALPD